MRVFADSLFTPANPRYLHGEGRLSGSALINDISIPGLRVPVGVGEICEIQVGGTRDQLEYTLVAAPGKQHELAALIRKNAQDQFKWDRMVEQRRERLKSQPQHEQEQTKQTHENTRDTGYRR